MRKYPEIITASFGIHPQNPDSSYISFLETLLEENRIQAVGEAGFDLYEPRFCAQEKEQLLVWNVQTELAARYNKPLIVHCRRAMPYLFRDSKQLSRLSTVVFHSWPGSAVEAFSLLKRGVHAYFVIGKQVLNGNKRALVSAQQLPLEMLLAETDAPYQTLKGQTETPSEDICAVYRKIADLRGMELAELTKQIYCNFVRAFSISGSSCL